MLILHSLQDIKKLIRSNKISILLIKAKHCGVCDAISMKLEELLKSLQNIALSAVYVEEVPEIAGEYMVFTAPTILVFVGDREVLRESRFIRFDEFKGRLGCLVEETSTIL